MFRQLLRLAPALVLAGLAFILLSGPRQASAKSNVVSPPDTAVVKQIHRYERETWRWQTLMGVGRTRTARAAETDPSHTFKVWVRNLWHRRALKVRRLAAHPPHKAGWLCIHRFEGAWNAATGNGYFGGLQMDLRFQRTYGRHLLRQKGTANHWTPLEQMWVAERAHRSGRGYSPWPNTARYCGLI